MFSLALPASEYSPERPDARRSGRDDRPAKARIAFGRRNFSKPVHEGQERIRGSPGSFLLFHDPRRFGPASALFYRSRPGGGSLPRRAARHRLSTEEIGHRMHSRSAHCFASFTVGQESERALFASQDQPLIGALMFICLGTYRNKLESTLKCSLNVFM